MREKAIMLLLSVRVKLEIQLREIFVWEAFNWVLFYCWSWKISGNYAAAIAVKRRVRKIFEAAIKLWNERKTKECEWMRYWEEETVQFSNSTSFVIREMQKRDDKWKKKSEWTSDCLHCVSIKWSREVNEFSLFLHFTMAEWTTFN